MNIRERFKTETNKNVEITENAFAHTVTVVNPEYVRWLENNNEKLEKQFTISKDIMNHYRELFIKFAKYSKYHIGSRSVDKALDQWLDILKNH